jgi:hypothetical protein
MVADEAKLLLNKGADYTAGKKDADAYANFRIIADLLKGAPITPYTVALIYGLKHVLSLITFAITGKQESGEGLRGRHMDARNYFFILNELVPDHVNHFESEMPEWMDVANAAFAKASRERGAEFTTHIAENVSTGEVKFFDDVAGVWRPLADLDKRKEVENTTARTRSESWTRPDVSELGLF